VVTIVLITTTIFLTTTTTMTIALTTTLPTTTTIALTTTMTTTIVQTATTLVTIMTIALIITTRADKNLYLSVRNLPSVSVTEVNDLDIVSLLRYRHTVVTRDALQEIEKWLQ